MTALPNPIITDEYGSYELKPYVPRGACEELFYCPADAILLEGPAGTGKSRSALELVKLCCLEFSNLRVLMVRKTRASMSETILPIWETKVLSPGMITGNAKRAHRDKYEMPRGNEVVLAGVDDTDKIMSAEYDLVVIFEATELNAEEYEHLTTRIGRDFRGDGFNRRIICDCNPGVPYHFLNTYAKQGKMVRLKSVHTNNPHLYDDDGKLTEVGIKYMSRLKKLSGARYQRLFLGNWAAADKLVYEAFDPEIHVIDEYWEPYKYFIGGTDWGWNDPGVHQIWGVDYKARAVLEYEIYRTHEDIDYWKAKAKLLHRKYRPKRWRCDHRPEYISQLRSVGIPAGKAKKDIQHGIQVFQARLQIQDDGKPMIYVKRNACAKPDLTLKEDGKPTCSIDEFWAYSYPDDVTRITRHDIPVDKDNHGMDTARYVQVDIDKYFRVE